MFIIRVLMSDDGKHTYIAEDMNAMMAILVVLELSSMVTRYTAVDTLGVPYVLPMRYFTKYGRYGVLFPDPDAPQVLYDDGDIIATIGHE